MADRVASDHDTVDTHRIALESVGRTDRLRIPLPDSLAVERGDVVRLTVDGNEYHARVTRTLDGSLVVAGAYDNARLARADDEGEDRLAAWFEDAGRGAGQSVLLDVLVSGSHYGLRAPGERVVYTVRDPPGDSLSDIARDIE